MRVCLLVCLWPVGLCWEPIPSSGSYNPGQARPGHQGGGEYNPGGSISGGGGYNPGGSIGIGGGYNPGGSSGGGGYNPGGGGGGGYNPGGGSRHGGHGLNQGGGAHNPGLAPWPMPWGNPGHGQPGHIHVHDHGHVHDHNHGGSQDHGQRGGAYNPGQGQAWETPAGGHGGQGPIFGGGGGFNPGGPVDCAAVSRRLEELERVCNIQIPDISGGNIVFGEDNPEHISEEQLAQPALWGANNPEPVGQDEGGAASIDLSPSMDCPRGCYWHVRRWKCMSSRGGRCRN